MTRLTATFYRQGKLLESSFVSRQRFVCDSLHSHDRPVTVPINDALDVISPGLQDPIIVQFPKPSTSG